MVRRERGLLAVGLLVAFVVAVAARWQGLAVTSALGDAMGPWWVGARGPLSTTPHAPPYGWMLAVPHAGLLAVCGSLWTAVAGMHVLQALVAPVGGLLTARLGGRALPGVVAGVALAVEPGLLDTTWSGSETYLGPLGLGLVALAWTLPRGGAWLAAVAFPWAVMNHPLALLAGAPLLAGVRWRRGPAVLGLALLMPHLVGLFGVAGGALGEGGAAAAGVALDAWGRTAGAWTLVLVVAVGAGLRERASRRLVGAGLVGLVLVVLAGAVLGYLRDHHLRLLTVPLVAGLAGLPRWSALLVVVGLRWPADPVERPSQALRPGTLGLLHHVVGLLEEVEDPLQVQAAAVQGAPVVEPGAVVLERWLRGGALGLGGPVAVVATVARGGADWLPAGLDELGGRDTWVLRVGTEDAVRAWTDKVCGRRPSTVLQHAYDGWVVVFPEAEAAELEAASGCGEGQE